jgi:hypothetical protein
MRAKAPHSMAPEEDEIRVVLGECRPFDVPGSEHFSVETSNTIRSVHEITVSEVTAESFQDQFDTAFDFTVIHRPASILFGAG